MRLWNVLVAVSGAACAGSAPPKVLFIGNSYTYFNNLPAMVSALGRGDGRPIQTAMIVRGGATLDDHWKGDSAAAAIRRGGWTHVVLQEQSQLGNYVVINGAPAIFDDGGFVAAAGRFDAIIRQGGAKT
ncbi:MAG: SGNH/GDSL hydrolase family protein, partial [Gemmatimonadota bacterium]